MEYPKDVLDKAPDMRGTLPASQTEAGLTKLELATLKHQGLLEEDGTISDAARVPEKEPDNFPSNFPRPIPLDQLVPESAAQVEEAVADIKGQSAEAAAADPGMRVDDPLPPPIEAIDLERANMVAEDTDDLSGGFGAATDIDVEQLIRSAKEPIPCPRCTYDMRQRFSEPEFSESDKAAFIRHVMSRNGRFEKEYPLFGKRVLVTLRSRSQSEMDAIYDYARKRLAAEKLLPGGDFVSQLQRYHIAASVAAVTIPDDKDNSDSYATLDELMQQSLDDPIATMDEQVFGTGQSAALFSAISAKWMEFDQLYGWLTSKAHDADF